MSKDWDDLMQQDSPHEQMVKNQRTREQAYRARFLKFRVDAKKWDIDKNNPWNYERQRLYTLLGLRKTNESYTTYDTYKTGTYVITPNGNNTYDVKEKESYSGYTEYVLEVDGSKIKDIKKYNELRERIDRFLYDAESKFGKNMIPAFFNRKERFRLHGHLLMLLLSWIIPIIFVFMSIYVIAFHVNYNKNHANYVPLVNAYFKQVMEFEREIKQIANFNYKAVDFESYMVRPQRTNRASFVLKGALKGMLCGVLGFGLMPTIGNLLYDANHPDSLHPLAWIIPLCIMAITTIIGAILGNKKYQNQSRIN